MFKPLSKISESHWTIFLLGNISSLANLILPFVLVRILSPEEMGLYKTFFLYLMIIPFLALAGGPVHSVYYWAGMEKSRRTEYIKQSWLVTLFLSSFILTVGFLILSFLNDYITHPGLPMGGLLLISFLSCPSGHYGEVCMARGKLLKGTLLALSFELIKIGGFIYVAYAHRNVSSLVNFFLILMIFSFLFMTGLAAKDNSMTLRIKKEKFLHVLRYSLPVSLSSGLYFLMERADQLVLAAYLAPRDFAVYSLGCLTIPPLYLLETSVQKVLIPRLTRSLMAKDYTSSVKEFRKAVEDMAFLIIPGVFGLVFFAPAIIELLFTAQYASASTYLQVFALSYVLLILPHDSAIRASGQTHLILRSSLLMTPLAFLILFLCIGTFSPIWILFFSLVLKLGLKLYLLSVSARILNVRSLDLIPWERLLAFSIVSGCLTLVFLNTRGLFDEQSSWLLVSVALFALIYLSVFLFDYLKNKIELIKCFLNS